MSGSESVQAAVPLLPPELERLILEDAAWGDRPTTVNLLRVARRVHVWIEPLLHRVLLYDALNAECIARLLNPKYASWVRCIASNDGPWSAILASCTNITDLAIWTNPSRYTLSDALSLRHLQRLTVHGANFERPLEEAHLHALDRLTHLEIFAAAPSEMMSTGTFEALSSLTHFSMIMMTIWDPLVPAHDIDDWRFVTIQLPDFKADWITGAWGGEDYWTRAEDIAQERKSLRVMEAPP
ncbi:hypothetical protein HMN09_00844000 [Mycena chlorophos]|uniref:Uncharacterized protein n=1 Tax=Mycena chlorophos TaxID=658473 RepID=A0A8H6W9R6_MYCCL|nr:hypothetical protein HMN09_00844000 [Mycena chlorophos]